MKRLTVVFLSCALTLGVISCSKKKTPPAKSGKPTTDLKNNPTKTSTGPRVNTSTPIPTSSANPTELEGFFSTGCLESERELGWYSVTDVVFNENTYSWYQYWYDNNSDCSEGYSSQYDVRYNGSFKIGATLSTDAKSSTKEIDWVNDVFEGANAYGILVLSSDRKQVQFSEAKTENRNKEILPQIFIKRQ